MSIQSSLNQTLALMGGLASINPQLSEKSRLKERAGELGKQVSSLSAQNEALTERNYAIKGENEKLQAKYDELEEGVFNLQSELQAADFNASLAEQKASEAEQRYKTFEEDVSNTLYSAAVKTYGGESNIPKDMTGKKLILDLADKVANIQAQNQEVAKLITGKYQKRKFNEIIKGSNK